MHESSAFQNHNHSFEQKCKNLCGGKWKGGMVNAGLLSLELRSMLNSNNWKLNGNNMNSGFETTDSQSNWASEHLQVSLNTILTGSRYMLVDVVNMFNLCCLACFHQMSSALPGQ